MSNQVETSVAVAFVGFGEAASAFAGGWREAGIAFSAAAYDIKTDSPSAAIRDAKRADYAAAGIDGSTSLGAALAEAEIVFSLVTADQAHAAAANVAWHDLGGAFFFDCNSCAPSTKRRSAQLIENAGGRYVDVAVMAPVHPRLHRTPLLVSGPHAQTAVEALKRLGMTAGIAAGELGAASAIKMTRSIMIKGLEALVAECVLAGRKAGIEDAVLDSLEETFPGFGWRKRAAYMLERAMTHGIRRAAEMREVALTVEELGLGSDMSRATVAWQQRLGDLKLVASAIAEDVGARADAILAALDADESKEASLG